MEMYDKLLTALEVRPIYAFMAIAVYTGLMTFSLKSKELVVGIKDKMLNKRRISLALRNYGFE